MHNDNDDDGESAAGSRLAHLLQILVGCVFFSFGSSFLSIHPLDSRHRPRQELDHILVVVTRYFGGIHLGPDRLVFPSTPPWRKTDAPCIVCLTDSSTSTSAPEMRSNLVDS